MALNKYRKQIALTTAILLVLGSLVGFFRSSASDVNRGTAITEMGQDGKLRENGQISSFDHLPLFMDGFLGAMATPELGEEIKEEMLENSASEIDDVVGYLWGLIESGRKLCSQGNYEGAVAKYNQAIGMAPGTAPL